MSLLLELSSSPEHASSSSLLQSRLQQLGEAGELQLRRRGSLLQCSTTAASHSASSPSKPSSGSSGERKLGESSLLLREADRLRMLMRNSRGDLQEFELALSETWNSYRGKEGKGKQSTGKEGLFSESQRNFLLLSVVEQLEVDEEFAEALGAVGEGLEGEELLETCVARGVVLSFFPPQAEDPKQHKELFRRAISAWPCDQKVIADVYEQFGSEVALYLSFMDHFIAWLVPPAAFGLVIFIINYLDSDMDVNTNLMIPLFSVFIILWAILFVQYFKRTCSSLGCEWGILGRGLKRDAMTKVRADFEGQVVISKVTGRKEMVYEWYKRIPHYCLSIVVTAMMLAVAFTIMVISLNLQGYINQSAMGAKLLHFPSISKYSQTGELFDNEGGGPYPVVLPYVPVVLHAVVIMLLNSCYRHIAESLTSFENHRTDVDYNNSLLAKRIFFEAFDCYIALFYLAFCQFDIVALRAELFGLYTADSIRRLATETVLPYLMNEWSARTSESASDGEEKVERKRASKSNKSKNKKKKSSIKTVNYSNMEVAGADNECSRDLSESVAKQFILDEYDNFDDYLEMVISFGYITLFASAFPLASTLTLFCVVLEVKSDIFKLFWVTRKPNPRPVADIGMWVNILTGLAWISVITNVFLFAFTTEQMMQIFPSFFKIADGYAQTEVNDDDSYLMEYDTEDRQHDVVMGKQGIVWGYCFCIEHVLLLFAGLVTIMVPERPSWVTEELQRQQYVKDMESRQLHKINHLSSKKND